VEIWLEVLNNQDETNPDLSIYNRVGDLYIKLKDPALAADYYDQAVDNTPSSAFTTTPSQCATRCCATLRHVRRRI